VKFEPPQTYTEDEIPDVFGGDRFSIDVSQVKDSFTDFLNMAEFLKTTTLTCETCSEFPCHRNQDPDRKIGFCYEVESDGRILEGQVKR